MDNRENFGSKLGAILAAAGSAVGLGNIWRFPIETGQNGGAAYIIIYIGCILLLGIPIMIAEFVIGRHTHCNTAGAYKKLAPGTQWKWVGRLGVFTGFIILGYYAVVAGWTLEYLFLSASNSLANKTPADYPIIFTEFSSNWWQPIIWTIGIFLLTHFVIVKGVKSGIERYSKLMMPTLFIIIIILVFCSVSLSGASKGIEFLLMPDFTKITSSTVLSAMGQAFYSLSLGMGCLCTYSSYFGKETNLTKTAANVCLIDTFVAILAGFIIFPAMFHAGYNLQPSDIGPSLIFITLPNVFQSAFVDAPLLGYIFAIMFYVLLALAAITSTISLHEVVTAFIHEEFKIKRRYAALIVTTGCFIIAIFCSLSFGVLDDAKLFGMSIFDFFDYISSNICLPIGGLLISIFVGWYLKKQLVKDEISNLGTIKTPLLSVMLFILQYITPLAILLILLNKLGMFDLL